MGELLKLLWDAVVLRDASRKGMLNWRAFAVAGGFVLLLYGIGLPAVLDYEKHPSHKPLFIAAMIFDLLLFLMLMIFGTRWWWQHRNGGNKRLT